MEKYKHDFHISKFIHNKYNDLVISTTFRSFAFSLISLFLPLYLLKSGFGIKTVVIFEMILLGVVSFLHILSIILASKFGLKKTLILSYGVSVIFYLVLHQMPLLKVMFGDLRYLLILCIFNLLSASLYWMPYHLYFIKVTKKNDEGKKLGILVGVPTILCIISPFVGGLLISKQSLI